MPARNLGLEFEEPSDLDIDAEWLHIKGLDDDVDAYVLVEWDSEYRATVREVRLRGSRVLAETMYNFPLGQVMRIVNAGVIMIGEGGATELVPPDKPGRLSRGPRQDPVAFAHEVALHYRWHAQASPSPAKAIAEANNVPVGTVRGWIRDARKLGQLPPGRRGRVG